MSPTIYVARAGSGVPLGAAPALAYLTTHINASETSARSTKTMNPIPYANLAANYNFQGMWEQAVENGIEAMRLGPNRR